MFDFFLPDLQPSATELARTEFFNKPRQAIVEPLDPGELYHQHRVIGQKSAQVPETQLTSFKKMDLRDFRPRNLSQQEMMQMQAEFEKNLAAKRKDQIAQLVDKLYEVKVFENKELKEDLKRVFELIEFNIGVIVNGEKIDHVPERLTNAINTLKKGGILTPKQIEDYIFGGGEPHEALFKLWMMENESRQLINDALPDEYKLDKVNPQDPKAEQAYRKAMGEIKPGLLKKYGIK